MTAVSPDVLEQFGIDEDAAFEPLGEGRVNTTTLVTEGDRRTVLQKMSSMFHESVVTDMTAVTDHLSAKGWEVPKTQLTVSGKLHYRDASGTLWRHSSHVESDRNVPQSVSTDLSAAAGKLLAGWHADMRGFEHRFGFQFPHFHDSEHITAKMYGYMNELPDPATYTMASELLGMRARHGVLEDNETQVIHGDPKLANMLFRRGQPFTLVDFDNVMRGSKWTDCGDFLRSLSGRLLSEGADPGSQIEAFAETYQGNDSLSGDRLQKQLRQATGEIALNLGMRYVCDVLDGSYFSWDDTKYESRRDHHLDRAEVQLAVARYALAE